MARNEIPIAWLEPGTDRPLFDLAAARALARLDPPSVRWADEHYQREMAALLTDRCIDQVVTVLQKEDNDYRQEMAALIVERVLEAT